MEQTSSRRDLFGASAALLVLAAPAVGATKARELDGELLAMCAEAMRLDALIEATDDGETIDAALERWGELVDAIAETPARTPEGLQAKAVIIRYLMAPIIQRWAEGDDSDQDLHDPLVWSLVRDLTGRAAA